MRDWATSEIWDLKFEIGEVEIGGSEIGGFKFSRGVYAAAARSGQFTAHCARRSRLRLRTNC